ncbi:MAG: hypothetical protein QXT49_04890 [Candidatus Nezhaarchaeales archaeon]
MEVEAFLYGLLDSLTTSLTPIATCSGLNLSLSPTFSISPITL